jgi:hypothetical protein
VGKVREDGERYLDEENHDDEARTIYFSKAKYLSKTGGRLTPQASINKDTWL